MYDLQYGGFGHSNGRFLSFLDSFNSCVKFRVLTETNASRRSKRTILAALILCFLTKYLSGTTASWILGHVPTVLRGPRHILSFFIAFVVAFLPTEPPRFVNKDSLTSIAVGFSIALYKLRKLMFVAHHSREGFHFMILVSVIAIEGSSMLRNVICRPSVLTLIGLPEDNCGSGAAAKTSSRSRNEWFSFVAYARYAYRYEFSKLTEILLAATAIFFACSASDVHESEPHFFDPILSLLHISLADVYYRTCVIPEDLSLTPCTLAKWIAFIALIVRYTKLPLVGLRAPTNASLANGGGARLAPFFFSPFKSRARWENRRSRRRLKCE